MKKYNGLLIFTVIMMTFAACAKSPTEEMAAAQTAVTKAENDPDVRLYGASGLARAREMLNNMRAENEQKRYAQAKQMASDTITLAEKAITDSHNASVRIRDEAANAVSQMQTQIVETEGTIESARTSKARGVNFKEIDEEFSAARTLAVQAEADKNESRYRDAIDKSQNVRGSLGNIASKIREGNMATSRKK
jgi:hypothetical protein